MFAMILLMSCKNVHTDSIYNYPTGVVVDKVITSDNTRYIFQIRYMSGTNLNRDPRQLTRTRGYVVNTIYVSKMEYMNYHIGDTIK